MLFNNRNTGLRLLRYLLDGVGVIVLLVAASTFHALVGAPLVTQTRSSGKRITKIEQQLAKAEETHATHRRLTESMASIKQRAEQVRQRIPEAADEAEFLKQITHAARESDVTIDDYRRGAMTELDTCSQLEVHLLCHGDYGSICGFFDQIAKLPRTSKIRKMKITAEPNAATYPVGVSLLLFFDMKQTVEDEERGPRA